jgi:hypothetical protein
MSNMPEGAQLSDDGQWWWDEENQQWKAVEGGAGGGAEAGQGGSGEAEGSKVPQVDNPEELLAQAMDAAQSEPTEEA